MFTKIKDEILFQKTCLNKNLISTIILYTLLSTGFIILVVYLLTFGKSKSLLGLNWIKKVDYELVITRSFMLNLMQIVLLFMNRIFSTRKNLKKDFISDSIAVITYLYLVNFVSLVVQYFNIDTLLKNTLIILNIIGFFIILYYIYLVLNTFELLHTKLENEKILTKHLYKLSFTDKLTGLPNRCYLLSLFEDYLSKYDKESFMLGILFLDLDGFKAVNDEFGHDVGDEVLKEISSRLVHCVRNIDTVARIGGDEFIILIPHIIDDVILEIIASRVIEVLNEKICIDNHEFTLGVSIGISIYSRDGFEINDLIKKADIAMYKVKKQGKNGYAFFQ